MKKIAQFHTVIDKNVKRVLYLTIKILGLIFFIK